MPGRLRLTHEMSLDLSGCSWFSRSICAYHRIGECQGNPDFDKLRHGVLIDTEETYSSFGCMAAKLGKGGVASVSVLGASFYAVTQHVGAGFVGLRRTQTES